MQDLEKKIPVLLGLGRVVTQQQRIMLWLERGSSSTADAWNEYGASTADAMSE